ncbi:cell adhesion molecule DSCAML1-like [Glandiceps talaboti]
MDNMAGSGPSSNQLLLATRPEIPPKVKDLTANVESSSVIRSTWTIPENLNCPLEGYVLVFEQALGYECGERMTFDITILDSDTYEYSVYNLYANAEYSVTVTAFTNSGTGTSSVAINTTYEDVPSVPLSVQALGLSDTEIQATWYPPKCPNGIIKTYMLYYWETGNMLRMGCFVNIDAVEAGSESVAYVVDGLKPATNYTVQVIAENSCCASIRSSIATAQTKPTSKPSPRSSAGVISGAVVGVSVPIHILVLLVFLYLRRKTGRPSRETSQGDLVSKKSNEEYAMPNLKGNIQDDSNYMEVGEVKGEIPEGEDTTYCDVKQGHHQGLSNEGHYADLERGNTDVYTSLSNPTGLGNNNIPE